MAAIDAKRTRGMRRKEGLLSGDAGTAALSVAPRPALQLIRDQRDLANPAFHIHVDANLCIIIGVVHPVVALAAQTFRMNLADAAAAGGIDAYVMRQMNGRFPDATVDAAIV